MILALHTVDCHASYRTLAMTIRILLRIPPSVIARGVSLVAIKRVGIPCSLIATLALLARNDEKIMRSDNLVSLRAKRSNDNWNLLSC